MSKSAALGVVMHLRRKLSRRDTERGDKMHGRAAAEAVAAARKAMAMAMPMERRLSVVIGMLLGAGLVVSLSR
jgi:hypothetical protein